MTTLHPFLRPKEQLHDWTAPGCSQTLITSFATHEYAAEVFEIFRGRKFGDVAPPIGEALEMLKLEKLGDAMIGWLKTNAEFVLDGSLDDCLEKADLLEEVRAGRNYSLGQEIEVEAKKIARQAGDRMVEALRQAAFVRPADAAKAIGDTQEVLSSAASAPTSGSRLDEFCEIAKRIQTLRTLKGDMTPAVKAAIEKAATIRLTSLFARAVAELGARQAWEAAVHDRSRLKALVKSIHTTSEDFLGLMQDVADLLHTRLATAQALAKESDAGYQLVLAGLSVGGVRHQLAQHYGVSSNSNPSEALGDLLLTHLRERLVSQHNRAKSEVQALSNFDVLRSLKKEEIVDELLLLIHGGIGETPVYEFLEQYPAGGVEGAANFLWNAAAPTAGPNHLGVRELGVRAVAINLVQLPPSEDHQDTRQALMRAFESLSENEGRCDIVDAPPGVKSVTVFRMKAGWPVPIEANNLDLLKAYGQGHRDGHSPTMCGFMGTVDSSSLAELVSLEKRMNGE